MVTTGHHACKSDGGIELVEKEAPFHSEYKKPTDENKESFNYPFLGSGYYFWDDNLDMAKFWGSRHYPKGYFIISSSLNIDYNAFLDLVGNRASQKWLKDAFKEFENYDESEDITTIGGLIEVIKKVSEELQDSTIFPYKGY